MKKKIIGTIVITIIIITTITVTSVLALTNMLTKGMITGKLYRVDNVYEEIWNLVNSEKNGIKTVLTIKVNGAYVDYDFGCFDRVVIPINEDCNVVLSFGNDTMRIWIFGDKNEYSKTPLYVYDYEKNTLYGNREEAYLISNFTSLYYSWVGDNSKFDLDNLGNYEFVLAEYPLSYE